MTAMTATSATSATSATTDSRWTDALTAAALLAVDPAGLGGALLRARCGPQRAHWLAQLHALLPAGTPQRRVPLHIADERLLGGLDLAATLHAGRPVAQRGVLADAHGGLAVLAMAERLAPATAARLAAVLDRGEVLIERDGITLRQPARLGLVALDEGMGDDEQAPAALADRLAFHLLLDDLPSRAPLFDAVTPADVLAARARLPGVASGSDTVRALCQTALALGIPSLRAPWLALRAACVVAALQGHDSVEPDDAALAARLVLGPRATQRPATAEAQNDPPDDTTGNTTGNSAGDTPDDPNARPQPAPAAAGQANPPPAPPPAPPAPPPPPADPGAAPGAPTPDNTSPPSPPVTLDDLVLEAALSSLPAGLLARLKAGLPQRSTPQAAGRAGALQRGGLRGRPLGARRGELRGGARLDLIATLRAAAPWQVLRRREALADAGADVVADAGADVVADVDTDAARATQAGHTASKAKSTPPAGAATAAPPSASATSTATATATATATHRVLVRREDFHIARRAQRSETTTVFVVDASGSAALARLAEAKGAVELLLADCYVRRDRVALLAFRGSTADLVLPPTRSLVRAKRALAGLPGGGGTPLATALDAATQLTSTIQRRGGTALVVLLSDARANINRQGAPGRSAALADALAAARQLRTSGASTLLVDTSPMPGRPPANSPPNQARQIADAMAALYLPLPKVDAAGLSGVVRGIAARARLR